MRGTIAFELIQLGKYWSKAWQADPSLSLNEEKVSFGNHSDQYLIHFKPDHIDPDKPIILYYHGGGWMFGRPELFRKKAQLFTRLGYEVIMPCYRKLMRYTGKEILEDVCLALKTIKELFAANKISIDRKIILGGISAGANLVSLIYFDSTLHKTSGFAQENFAGLFLFAPPMDLTKMKSSSILYRYAGKANKPLFKRTNPINHIAYSRPIPILCMHGNKDGFVRQAASLSFKELYDKLHPNYLEYIPLVDGTHLDAASWAVMDNDLRRRLIQWLESTSSKIK